MNGEKKTAEGVAAPASEQVVSPKPAVMPILVIEALLIS